MLLLVLNHTDRFGKKIGNVRCLIGVNAEYIQHGGVCHDSEIDLLMCHCWVLRLEAVIVPTVLRQLPTRQLPSKNLSYSYCSLRNYDG